MEEIFNEIWVAIMIGLMGGMMGVFFRNTLKPRNMIFNAWFDLLEFWVERARIHETVEGFAEASGWHKFLGNWLAYVLGYCIYCTTTWLTILLYVVIVKGVDWWLFMALGVQHVVVLIFCVFVLPKEETLKHDRRDWTQEERDLRRGL